MRELRNALTKSVLAPCGLKLRVELQDPPLRANPNAICTYAVIGDACVVSLASKVPEQARPYVLTAQVVAAARVYRGFPEFGQTAVAYDHNLAQVNVAATLLTHAPSVRHACQENHIDVSAGLQATFDPSTLVTVSGAKLSPKHLGVQFGCLRLATALCLSPSSRVDLLPRRRHRELFRILLWAEELVELVGSYDMENSGTCWEAMVALLKALNLDGYTTISNRAGRYYFDGRYSQMGA